MFADLDLSDDIRVTPVVVGTGSDPDEADLSVRSSRSDVKHHLADADNSRTSTDGGEVVLLTDVGYDQSSVALDFVNDCRVKRDVGNDVRACLRCSPLVGYATTTVAVRELNALEGADEAVADGCRSNGAFAGRRCYNLDWLVL